MRMSCGRVGPNMQMTCGYVDPYMRNSCRCVGPNMRKLLFISTESYYDARIHEC